MPSLAEMLGCFDLLTACTASDALAEVVSFNEAARATLRAETDATCDYEPGDLLDGLPVITRTFPHHSERLALRAVALHADHSLCLVDRRVVTRAGQRVAVIDARFRHDYRNQIRWPIVASAICSRL